MTWSYRSSLQIHCPRFGSTVLCVVCQASTTAVAAAANQTDSPRLVNHLNTCYHKHKPTRYRVRGQTVSVQKKSRTTLDVFNTYPPYTYSTIRVTLLSVTFILLNEFSVALRHVVLDVEYVRWVLCLPWALGFLACPAANCRDVGLGPSYSRFSTELILRMLELRLGVRAGFVSAFRRALTAHLVFGQAELLAVLGFRCWQAQPTSTVCETRSTVRGLIELPASRAGFIDAQS